MADFSEKLRAKAATIATLNADSEYESKNWNVEYRSVEILRELPDNSLIPSLKPDDYQNLFESIRQEMKIRTPVHIAKDNTVLCGNNRLKIAKEIGIKEIPVIVVDVPKEKYFFYALEDNLFRRQLNDAQKAELILMLKPELQKKQLENKAENFNKNKSNKRVESNPLGRTRDILAKKAGVSIDVIKKSEKIKKENPQLFNEVKKGAVSIHRAYNQVKATMSDSISGKTGIRKINRNETRRVITVTCEDDKSFYYISQLIDTAAEEIKNLEEVHV